MRRSALQRVASLLRAGRIERHDQVRSMAFDQAKREVDDEAARHELAAILEEFDSEAIEKALTGWGRRSGYLDDRAYRLLSAVRNHSPVPEIHPGVQEQFHAEAILGHLPLPEAFQRLTAAEPRLREMELPVRAGGKVPAGQLRQLLGPGTGAADPMLQTDAALQIATIYLWMQSRGQPLGDASYFERFGFSRSTTSGFDS